MGTSPNREKGRGNREQGCKGGPEGFEPRVEEGPRALGRVSGREGCAGVNVIGRGGPWQGGLPGSTKHRMVKPCSLGVHPRACGRSLNGTPTMELSCRTTKTGALVLRPGRRVSPPWVPSRRALSLSIRSFFEVRTSLATLRTGTRTAHTPRACTRLSEVWEVEPGQEGENAKEKRTRRAGSR